MQIIDDLSAILWSTLLNRIARVLICLVFIKEVIGKFGALTETADAIAAKSLPLAAPSVISAVLLLNILIPTTLLFHRNAGDAAERIQLLKNLSIMAGLLFVVEQVNS